VRVGKQVYARTSGGTRKQLYWGVHGIEYDRRKAVSPLRSRLCLSYGGQAATALQGLGTPSTSQGISQPSE